MSNILTEDIIYILIAIGIFLIALFCFIMVIRIIFYLLLFILSKIYGDLKFRKKKNHTLHPASTTSVYKKEDDQLYKNMYKEKKKEREEIDSLRNVEKFGAIANSEDVKGFAQETEDRIVGVVKPIGFWTSFVLGKQLTQMVANAQGFSNSKQNFWVNMVMSRNNGLNNNTNDDDYMRSNRGDEFLRQRKNGRGR